MNLLFVHDHKLRYINENYYTLGGLSDEVTNRYTDIFNNMTIVCRAIPKQDSDKNLFRITNKNVTIEPIMGSSLILSKDKKNHIKNEVIKSDVVIARLPSIIGEVAIKYARKYNKKYMIESVGCAWDALWNHSLKGKIMAPYMYIKTKNAIKNSPYTTYVTKEFLQKRYPCKGITNACSDVSLTEFDDKILEKRKNRIKNLGKTITLGTLGAIDVKYKGHRYVIEAISILNKEGYDFEYEIVGSGSSEYLINVAKQFNVLDKVRFIGVLSHDKVFEWIDNIDIYIQPSKQEGLPRALVESMSRGCPAIGSNTGGIPELIEDDYIFRKGDINGICNILKKINSENLKMQSVYNYEKSKQYDKDILNYSRVKFYTNFRESIKQNE